MQNRTLLIIITVLAAGLVIVSALLVRRVYFVKTIAPSPSINTPITETNTNTETPIVTGHDIINTKTISFLSSPLVYNAQQISDRLGIKITALAETEPRDPTKQYSDEYALTFSKLGTVNNSELYAISQDCVSIQDPNDEWSSTLEYLPTDCVQINVLAVFDSAKKIFRVFSKHSSGIGSAYRNLPDTMPQPLDKVTMMTDETISDLTVPIKVTLPYGYSLSAYFPTLILTGLPTPDNTNSQEEHKLVGVSLEGYNIYLSSVGTDNYQLKTVDFGFVGYNMNVPFYANRRIPEITWNDGAKNNTDYSPYSWRTGSGTFDEGGDMNLISNNEAGDFYSRFAAVGKASNGEYVYAPKTATDPLVERYTAGRLSDSAQYDMSRPPIFLNQNPLNQIIVWTKTELLPMAERGKPVVYLYPTQTEKVSVKLGRQVEVKQSEPEYKDGWAVTAQPDGTLTTADGGTYPYLYWDGNSAAYETPKTGSVVASDDVKSFLSSKLAQLGLNAKEIFDFNEFWVPIVTKSPYALISFVPQDEWSKAAPLAISPAPNTLIRVFMDWKPLSAPISIAPQILPPTPVRVGFTAVEWGGLLYK